MSIVYSVLESESGGLAVCHELGDRAGMGRCYGTMAGLAKKAGDNANLREYARKAVIISEEPGIPLQPSLREIASM